MGLHWGRNQVRTIAGPVANPGNTDIPMKQIECSDLESMYQIDIKKEEKK